MATRIPRPCPDCDEPRGFIPPAPEDRPVRARRAVRVLLVDALDRVLLFEDSDLGLDPVLHWWVTPGGGVDPGESDLQAAIRELREETGLVAVADDLIGPVAVRHVVHGYSDQVAQQDEVFYVLRTGSFEVDVTGHTPQEQETVHDIRWWPIDELAVTDDDVWPRNLLAILALADDEIRWGAAPVDLGTSEESSVPA